jgi:hypothetical protein
VAWILIVLTVLVVVAIALVVIGRVTEEMVSAPPATLFDIDEAVEFVAAGLPEDTTAQLSYGEVQALIEWHLEYLGARGVAAERGPRDPTAGPLLAVEDDGLAAVIGRADEAGLGIDDGQVAEVLDLVGAYLRRIGAVGAPVPTEGPATDDSTTGDPATGGAPAGGPDPGR